MQSKLGSDHTMTGFLPFALHNNFLCIRRSNQSSTSKSVYALCIRLVDEQKHPQNPWERYADDAVIHCRTEQEAKTLLFQLNTRMAECRLELHPDKTKIVYYRSDVNPEHYEHESFDFLGYTFRRRIVKSKHGNFFNALLQQSAKVQVNICETVSERYEETTKLLRLRSWPSG